MKHRYEHFKGLSDHRITLRILEKSSITLYINYFYHILKNGSDKYITQLREINMKKCVF